MSIRINNSCGAPLPPGSVLVVYDIEGIGDVSNPTTCHIWNLSAMVLGNPQNVFDQFIQPVVPIPDPPHPSLFKVSRKFLVDANAQSCGEVLKYFFKWIQNNCASTGYIVLVSHGNFRYDQPLLQQEIIRNSIQPPKNLYFLDTLHWFRKILKDTTSFSLNNLYKAQFKRPIRNAHLALFDVHALHDLISAQNKPLDGIIYKCFYTAMLRIPSVGIYTESVLYDNEFYSVEHMIHKFNNEYQKNPAKMLEGLIRINVRPCIANTITTHIRCASCC